MIYSVSLEPSLVLPVERLLEPRTGWHCYTRSRNISVLQFSRPRYQTLRDQYINLDSYRAKARRQFGVFCFGCIVSSIIQCAKKSFII
jgi:hypothetical protein